MKKGILTLGAALLLSGVNAQTPGDLDLTFGVGGFTLTDPYAATGELYWDMITLSDDKIIKVGYTDDGGDSDILISKFLSNGIPDSTFGVNGFVQIDMSLGGNEDARGVIELPSGQLLVTGFVQTPGTFDGYVMRLNADGSVDFTFGTSPGHTKFNTGDNLIAYGRSVISNGNDIYVGGAVLVGGQSDIVIVKLTQGGGLAVGFASGGYATKDIAGGNDDLLAMDLQANGSFIFGGTADSAGVQLGYVAKLTQFGTPTSFGTNGNGAFTFDHGSGVNEVNDLYVDANDNVILAGAEGAFPDIQGIVKKLTSTGSLDAIFGSNGEISSNPGATTGIIFRGIMETADGDIIAVGNTDGASQGIYAMIVDNSGGFVNYFGGNTDVTIPFTISTNTLSAMSGDLQSDGSIIIGGYLTSQDFVGENMFMVRLYPYVDNSSIEEFTKKAIVVYPNPAQDQFKVDMQNIKQVELISTEGRIVKSWGEQSSYDLPSGITTGVYLIRVESALTQGITRIVIK